MKIISHIVEQSMSVGLASFWLRDSRQTKCVLRDCICIIYLICLLPALLNPTPSAITNYCQAHPSHAFVYHSFNLILKERCGFSQAHRCFWRIYLTDNSVHSMYGTMFKHTILITTVKYRQQIQKNNPPYYDFGKYAQCSKQNQKSTS